MVQVRTTVEIWEGTHICKKEGYRTRVDMVYTFPIKSLQGVVKPSSECPRVEQLDIDVNPIQLTLEQLDIDLNPIQLTLAYARRRAYI